MAFKTDRVIWRIEVKCEKQIIRSSPLHYLILTAIICFSHIISILYTLADALSSFFFNYIFSFIW